MCWTISLVGVHVMASLAIQELHRGSLISGTLHEVFEWQHNPYEEPDDLVPTVSPGLHDSGSMHSVLMRCLHEVFGKHANETTVMAGSRSHEASLTMSCKGATASRTNVTRARHGSHG